MFVSVHLQSASEPIEYHDAIGTFQKGDLFCVSFTNSDGETMTDKYPIMNIHKIRNSYPQTDRGDDGLWRLEDYPDTLEEFIDMLREHYMIDVYVPLDGYMKSPSSGHEYVVDAISRGPEKEFAEFFMNSIDGKWDGGLPILIREYDKKSNYIAYFRKK